MSSVPDFQAYFIHHKLNWLEQQIDNPQAFWNEAKLVLKDGRAWVDGTERSDLTYEEPNKKIEEMALLLSSKGQAAADSSDSQIPGSQEETLPIEGASATGQTQPSSTLRENLTRAGPTHQTGHSIVGHETVPGHVKQILSRLDVMEVAFSTLKTSTEKMSETQTEVQTQIENIQQNQSQMEEKQTKQLADIEKKVKKMGKHTEGIKQQEKKVTNLEKEVEAVKEREKRVTALESEIQTMKKQEKKMNSLQDEMVAVISQLHGLEEKTFRKISKVEKQVEVNADMIYHVKSRTESLSAKTEAMDTTVQDLSNRMDENQSLLDRLSTSHDEHIQKIDSLEQKTRNMAKKVNKNQKTFEEKLEEVKTEYKMVCHIVANRLLPLEKLRTILNQKIKSRDENVKRLGDVCDKVSDLEQKITDLGNKVSSTVGFTAYPPLVLTPVPNVHNIITSFTNVRCNLGNHFDSSTGIFTAPCDGIYIVYCSIWQWGNGGVGVAAYHKVANSGLNNTQDKWVCLTGTCVEKTSSSGFGLVQMIAGDSLCVKVTYKEGNAKLDGFSSFSCVRIS